MSSVTVTPIGRLKEKFSLDRSWLLFVTQLTGISSLVAQYISVTVLTYILGNSLEQYIVGTGLVFLGMAIGTWLQKRVRPGSEPTVFVLVELFLGITTAFAPFFLLWMYAHLETSFDYARVLYMIIPGVVIAMEIPMYARINEMRTSSLGENLSQSWGGDYLGGAIGSIVWLLMLRMFIPLHHASIVIGAFNIIVALCSIVYFRHRGMFRRRHTTVWVSLLTVGCMTFMTFGTANVSAWTNAVGQHLYDDPIEFAITTKYQNIVLTKGVHPTNHSDHNWQLWLNGNKQFSSVDEPIYHELLVHPAMNLAARHERVLILGGGDGLALREILKYDDVKQVTMVDLDPEMIKFASSHPAMTRLNENAFADARVSTELPGVVDTGQTQKIVVATDQTQTLECNEVVNERGETSSECVRIPVVEEIATVNVFNIDADKFFDAPSEPWDVVIVDLPDPNSIELAKLYSVEFYTKIRKAMSPDGVVVVQATSPYHAKEAFLCILRTLSAAGLSTLPYHENVPSFGDWGWVMGSPTLSEDELRHRAETLNDFGVETRMVDAGVLHRALIFNKGSLSSENSRVSTLLDPVIFQFYEVQGWQIE